MTGSFNLLDEPWVPVEDMTGVHRDVSVRELFAAAPRLRRLEGDLRTQTFALHRLLLAILHRATDPDPSRWATWWRTASLPLDQIETYLMAHHPRFDLLHPVRPFYQVADLRTTKGEFTELARLIGDAGSDYLSTRAHESIASISLAEAARWTVHCQAFDVSGIKSGAIGDGRVKGGKGYPIGVGAAGQIGGLLLEGESLLETLLLNLVPQDSGVEDFAAWELEWGASTQFDASYRPTGRAEVLTWQSRRIRLEIQNDRAIGVLIANGDRFSPVNLDTVETMTAWRESKPQAQKLGITTAFMPRLHVPGRSVWRGLEALIASSREPGVVSWVESRVGERILPEDFVPRVHTFGIDYVNQASIVGDVVHDEIDLPVRVLQRVRPEMTQVVVGAVRDADAAAQAFGNLASNLQRAAGGDGTARDTSRELLLARLDEPFRRWLGSLASPQVGATAAELAWARTLRGVALQSGSEAARDAGTAAWVGRIVNERHLDSGLAEAWYRQAIHKIVDTATLEESA